MTLSIETTTIYTTGNESYKPFNINFTVPQPVNVPLVLNKTNGERLRMILKKKAKLNRHKENQTTFSMAGRKYRDSVQNKFSLFTDKLEERLEKEKKYPSHGNNRTALAKHRRIKEIKNLQLPRTEGYFKVPTYGPTDYFKGWIDKMKHRDFRSINTSFSLPSSLQSALKSVPIYVLYNGRGEITQSRNIIETKPVSWSLDQIAGGCRSDVLERTSRGNMQFFFMTRKDLEDHKALALQLLYPTNRGPVWGVSASCVGLDTAYRQVRSHGLGQMITRYHIMPDSDELSTFLTKNIRKPNLVVDEEQGIRSVKRTLKNIRTPRISFPKNKYTFISKTVKNKINRYSTLLYKFTSGKKLFPKAFQHSYKGTPIYIVQLQDKKYPKYFDKYTKRLVGDEFIGLGSRLINFGSSPLLQGSLKEISTPSGTRNFVFFKYEEAADFSKNNANNTRKYDFFKMQSYPLLKQLNPDIFASSLEAVMEMWEDASIKKENNNFFDPSHTYFVPTEEGIKDLEMKDPRVGGPKYKTYKQDLFIRFNTVKGYIKTILLDGPLYVKSYQPK